MKKTRMQKVLAWMLAAAMTVNACPTNAFAQEASVQAVEESTEEAVQYAAAQEEEKKAEEEAAKKKAAEEEAAKKAAEEEAAKKAAEEAAAKKAAEEAAAKKAAEEEAAKKAAEEEAAKKAAEEAAAKKAAEEEAAKKAAEEAAAKKAAEEEAAKKAAEEAAAKKAAEEEAAKKAAEEEAAKKAAEEGTAQTDSSESTEKAPETDSSETSSEKQGEDPAHTGDETEKPAGETEPVETELHESEQSSEAETELTSEVTTEAGTEEPETEAVTEALTETEIETETETEELPKITISAVDQKNEIIDGYKERALPAFGEKLVLSKKEAAPIKIKGYQYSFAEYKGREITSVLDKESEKGRETLYLTFKDSNEEMEISEDIHIILHYEWVDVKRVYTYEDSKVKVTATLEKVDAVPDDAEFRVTEITPSTPGYSYDTYLDVINKQATKNGPADSHEAYMRAISGEYASTSEPYQDYNTLIYDIAFLVDKTDENGNVIHGELVEYQPEAGSVSIQIRFKKNQLKEIGLDEDHELEVVHLPLKDAVKESVNTTQEATNLSVKDIRYDVVDDAVERNKKQVNFSLGDFSPVALLAANHSDKVAGGNVSAVNIDKVLGRAVEYGILADTFNQDNHAQTNFAVKHYIYNGYNDDPDLAGSNVVPFIVGEMSNGMRFGGSTYGGQVMQYDIYTDVAYQEVIDREIAENKQGDRRTYIKLDNVSKVNTHMIYQDQDTITANVDRMIHHISGWSSALAAKSGENADIQLPANTNYNKYVLDTTGYDDNAVIYVDVPQGFVNKILSLEGALNSDGTIGQGFVINKKPNQNIVLNIHNDSNITIGKTSVNLNGVVNLSSDGNNANYTISPLNATSTDTTIGESDHNKAVDENVAQHIFYNFMGSGEVELKVAAGVFLAPNADVRVTGSSAGWIASGKRVTNKNAEFHYIYHKRAYKETTKDAVYFSFTKEVWDAQNNNLGLHDKTFSFELYETDESFSIEGKNPIQTKTTNENSKVTFDEIEINEDAEGYHYYVIKEVNGGETIDGIQYWGGQLNIQMLVEGEGSGFKKTIETWKTEHRTRDQGIITKHNDPFVVNNPEVTNGEIINSLPEYGNLKLTKTIKGAVTEAEAEGALRFEVTTEDGKWLKADGTFSDTQVELTLADFTHDPGTKIYTLLFEDISAGKYTVTETTKNVDGKDVTVTYTINKEGADAGEPEAGEAAEAEVEKDKTTTVAFEDDYVDYTGKLELTKTIEGDITEAEAEGALTFEVKNEAGKWLKADGTLSDTKVELTLKDFTHEEGSDTYILTFNKALVGNYTVTETTKDITGKDVTVTYTVAKEGEEAGEAQTGKEAQAGVEKDKTTTVAFKDDYADQKGKLELTKTIEGDITEAEAEGALTFEVKTAAGKWLKADGTLSDTKVELTLKDFTHEEGSDTYTLTFNEILVGSYTVTETTKDITGKDVTVTYTVAKEGEEAGEAQSGKEAQAGVEKDKTTTVAFKDDYAAHKGNLELTKTIEGDITEEEAEGALTFEVKTEAGKWLKADGTLSDSKIELTLKDFTHEEGSDTYTLTFNEILVGSYTVTETTKDITGKDVTVTYTVAKEGEEAGEAQTGKEAQAGVEKDKTTTVAFKDDYAAHKGNLELTKTIEGDITEEEAEGALTFEVKTEAGKWLKADGTLSDSKIELTLKDFTHEEGSDTYTLTFNKILVGSYTVTETTKDITGKDVTVTYTVAKEGEEAGEAQTGKEAQAGVQKDKTTTVAFKDDYAAHKGILELTKTIEGDITEEEAEGALTFEVKTEAGKWLKADGTLSDSKVELTLKDFTHEEGSDTYTLTFDKALVGNYTVTETTKDITGKDVTVTYTVAKEGEEAGEAQTGKEAQAGVEKDKTTTVAFKDDYAAHKGILELTKTIEGDITEEEAEGALTFEVKTEAGKWLKADGTLSDSKVELTLKDFTHEEGSDTYTLTFDKALVGNYTVTETTKDITGKDVTVTYTVAKEGEEAGEAQTGKEAQAGVEKDKTTTVAFKDDYAAHKGILELTKTIEGDITEEEAEGALTFEVKTEAGKWLKADGTLSDTKVELTLKEFAHDKGSDTYTLTFDKALVGNYTVTETTKDITGKDVTVTYTVAKEGEEAGEAQTGKEAQAGVEKDKTTTVAFKDDYAAHKGILELTKTIEGDITEEEAEGALTFEVKTEAGKWLKADGTLSDSKIELTLKDFTHEEGSDTYTLTFNEILVGNYTVTETTKDITGKDVTVTYTVAKEGEEAGEAQTGKEAQAGVEKDKTTTVAFKDDYAAHKGILELTKTIEGDITEEEAEGALTFEVKTEAGKWLKADGTLSDTKVELTLKDFTHEEGSDTYTLTFNEILVGSYTVTETTKDITGKDVTVTYTVAKEGEEAGEAQTGKEAQAGVEKDKTTTVAFKDDYVAHKGNLELTKTIKGDITEEEAEGALTFVIAMKVTEGESEVTKYLKTDKTLTADEKEAVLTLADFEHEEGTNEYILRLEDIDLGSYTVTETTKDIDGKTYTVSYTVNDGEKTEGNAAEAAVEAGKTTTVAFEDDFTNKPEAGKGNLELVKTIKGDITEEEAEGALTFVIATKVTEDGSEVTKYLKADKTLTDNKDEAVLTLADFEHEEGESEYILRLEDIDLGSYTVTETTKDVDGKEHTVKYSVNGGEQTEGKEAAATIEDGKTTKVEFEDNFENKTGSLELTKTIKGEITKEEAEGALTFEVKTKDGKWLDAKGNLSDKEVKLTLKDFEYDKTADKYTLKIDKVDIGAYTVTETTKDVDGKEHTVKYSVNGGEQTEGKEAAATIEDGKTTKVDFEDNFENKTGSLELTKTIKGEITKEEAEGALTFEVKTKDGKWLDADGNLSDKEVKLTLKDFDYDKTADKYTLKIDKVDIGAYTVTETTKDVDGKEHTVKYSVNGGEQTEGKEAAATIEDGKTTKVDFEDNFENKTGSLELTKTIKGEITKEEAEGALTFEVKTKDGKWLDADGNLSDKEVKLTLKDFDYDKTADKYTLKIDKVDIGAYTVTETTKDVDGKEHTVKYSVNGGEQTEGKEAAASIEDGKTTKVEFEDNFENKTGSLELTKTIKGEITKEEAEGALTFEVKTKDGKWLDADGNLSDKEVKLTLKDFDYDKTADKYTLKIDKVDIGAYTVTETTKDVDGKEHTVKYSVNGGEQTEGNEATATIEDGKTTKVDFEDNFENKTGSLELTKTIKGEITKEEAEGALTFEVKTKDGKWLDADGNLSDKEVKLTLKDFDYDKTADKYTLKIDKVDIGAYTVTETTKDVDGKEHTVKYSVNGGEQTEGNETAATIEDGKTTKVDFEDNFENKPGNLELTKTIKGDITEEEAAGALTFVVKAENGKFLDKDGNLVDDEKDATLTLADFEHEEGTKVYTLKIEDVDLGNYTVTETTKDIDGKTYTVSYTVNDGEKTEGNAAKAAVEAGKTTTVAFEDDFTNKPGNLELTKTIKGDITEEEAAGALTFVVKAENGKFLDKDGNLVDDEKDATLTLADFEHEEGTKVYTLKIEDVDLGNYTVTETTKDIDGKTYTVSYTVNDGEKTEGNAAKAAVEAGKTTTVAFEDDFTNKPGNLELTKTIKGDITEEEAAGALTFVVKAENGKFLDKDGNLVDDEKDATLTLADFEHEEGTKVYTLKIEDVDLGNYTVTETTKDIDGKTYTVSYTVNEGEKTEGNAAEAAVEAGKTTTVAFEDDFTNKPGNLELTKTIKGDITEEEAAGALTFVVKAENGKFLDKDGNLVDDEKDATLTLADFEHEEGTKVYTLKIEDVDLGNYTVTETTKDIDGKTYTVSYTVNDGEKTEGNAAKAAVEAGKTTTVAFEDDFTNTPEAGKGNLELVKTIKGDITEEEAEGALTFVIATKVTEDGSEVTKYLKADKTLTDNKDEAVLTLADFEHEEGESEYILRLEDIDLGSYTVTETTKDIDGKEHTVKYSVNGGDKAEGTEAEAEVEDGKTTKVEFEDNFENKTGSLELTKTIKGEITKEEAEGALTFEVKTKDGKWLDADGNLSDKEVKLTLKDFDYDKTADKYTLKIDKVDIGAYTVTETTKDVDGKEHTVKYSVNGGEQTEGNEAAATIEDGKTTKVEFEDNFENKTGSLELTKTIKGEITKEEAEGALTFEVKTKDGKWLDADGNLSDKEVKLTLKDFDYDKTADKYTLKIDKVDIGAYTVTETTKDVDGKEHTVKYSVNGGEQTEGKEAAATIEDGKTTKVDFEDNFENKTGSLELTKTIKGQITKEEAEGALTFEVKTKDGKWLDADGNLSDKEVKLTLKDFEYDKTADKYTLKIDKVDIGAYTVTETTKDVDGKEHTVKYSVNGGEQTEGKEAAATIEDGKTTKVDFEDNFENKTGSLELTKTIKGQITKEEAEGALTFEVKTQDGKWLDAKGNLSDKEVKLTLKDFEYDKTADKYTLKIEKVDIGEYTVTETTKDVDGKEHTVKYSVNGGEQTEGKEAAATIEDGKTTKVDFEDNFENKPGNLELTKTIKGDITEEEAAGALTFVVKAENGKFLDKDGNLVDDEKDATLTLADFEHEDGTKVYTLKIKDVDLGNYTVTETTKDINGKTYTVSYTVNDGEKTEGNAAEAAVEAGKTTTVAFEDDFTNKPEAGKGNLELVKTIKGDITEEEAEGALTFVIATKVTEDGSEVTKYVKADKTLTDNKDEAVLTLADFEHEEGESEYILRLEDIDLGSYTVTETTKDVDGKEHTVKYSVNGGEQTEGKEAAATIEDGKTTKVEFEDNFENKTGSLELTKTIKGQITKEEAEGALTFEVKTKDGKWLDADGNLSDKEVKLTLKDFEYDKTADKYTLKIDKVDIGAYTVTETTKDVDGKEHTVKYSVNGGEQTEGNEAAATIEDGKTTKVEFEDNFENKTGSLELTKTIKGQITKEEAEGALTFEVKTKDGKWLDAKGNLSDKEVKLTLKDFEYDKTADKYTLKIDKVDIGAYTVTETTKDVEGKEHTVKYSVNGGEQTEGKEAAASIEDGKTTKVDFEDNFENKPGNLELTKTIKGDITEEEAAGALTFVVKAENGKFLDKDGNLVDDEKDATLTLADFEHEEGTKVYTLKIEDVDLGNYTVTETTKDIDGKTYTVSYTVNDGEKTEGNAAKAAVEAGKTTTVAFEDDFTNKPEAGKGNLELVKTIKGDITEEEAEGALTFVIATKVTEDGSEVTKYLKADKTLTADEKEAVLTLADFEHEEGKSEYVLRLENIDLGSYTVTETTKDIDGKEHTVKYSVNGGDKAEGTEAEAEVEDGKTTKVEFEDNFENKTGGLELTKTIKGDVTKEEAEGALTFEVKTKDGKWLNADGSLSDKEVKLTLKDFEYDKTADKYTLKIDKVNIGDYTVTETTKDFDGKEHTVKYSVNGSEQTEGKEAAATVEDGKTTKVEFEDTFENKTTDKQTGNLELTEIFKGDVTDEEGRKAITFEVKTEDGKWLTKDGTPSDTKTELTLEDFEKTGDKTYKLVFKDIEVGTYTITETKKDIDGKKVTVTCSVTEEGGEAGTTEKKNTTTGKVEAGKTTKVDFENEYKKDSKSEEEPKDEKIHFVVKLVEEGTDTEISGSKIELVDENGKVVDTWTSKEGKAHDFGDKLKPGKKYTLRQSGAPKGYAYFNDVKVSVDKDGNVKTSLKKTKDDNGDTVYQIEEKPIIVKIKNTDISKGEDSAFTNSQMQLIDSKGNIVKTWPSGEGIEIFKDLVAGETYTIHQPAVPGGYEQEPGGDVVFKIEKNGDITKVSTTGAYRNGVIKVRNAPKGYNWQSASAGNANSNQQNQQNGNAKTSNVKTGDNTPIFGWLFAMLMSFAVILFVIFRRRRSRC